MEKPSETKLKNQDITRSPIVVVMGHIDHGKTKILDWYRKTKVVEQESGGITQHIGAYEVEHKGKKITFIDTPGHEAFSALRSRGAKVADIAILVVAAEEGVKPQTKEAIRIIKENSLPFIVAINKVDKPEANPERVKQELAQEEVLVESYGGKVPAVEISAKQGTRMDDLLEIILLVAELENLKATPEKLAEGVVIEAHLDPKRGVTASLLVLDGTLHKGDLVVVDRDMETVKILEDFRGKTIEQAYPSFPIRIAGLGNMPKAGDTFKAFSKRGEAQNFLASVPREKESSRALGVTKSKEETRPVFNIVLKADVVGSREALEEALKKLESEAILINITSSGVGDINESDIKLALSTRLVTIVGFKVKVDPAVKQLAEGSNIHMLTGEVIYELIDAVKKEAEEIIPPEVRRTELGRAKVLKIFKQSGAKQIVGGRVEDGVMKNSAKVEVQRNKDIVGEGEMLELQQNKQKVNEVAKGLEFGMLVDSKTALQEGDLLIVFREEKVKAVI